MDLFELWASLGIDAGGFITGLNDALQWALDAVIDFGKDVIKTGMDAEAAEGAALAVMRNVTKESEEWLKLHQHVLEAASDSVFTVEEAWNAVEEMGRLGFETADAMDSLVPILNLAAVEEMGLAQASKIVGSTLRGFGYDTEEAAYLVDILAQTSRSSGTNVVQMGKAFEYASGAAGALGVDVDDVALALGLMGDKAILSGKAGRTLRNVFSRLANDTSGAATTLESYGVQVFDAGGKMRDFGDILMDARDAWAKMDERAKISNATIVGGTTGYVGWLDIMNATDQQVNDLADSIANADGAAQEMAETIRDNFAGSVSKLNSKLDALKNVLYEDVKSPLKEVADFGVEAIERITHAVEEDGLIGGIRQLGVEITRFGDEYKEEIRALGEAIVPILTEFVETITPAFVGAVKTLGGALVEGLWDGAKEKIGENWLSTLLATMFGPVGTPAQFNATQESIARDAAEFKRKLGLEIDSGDPVSVSPEIELSLENLTVDPAKINDAIARAWLGGENTISLAGLTFDINQPAEEVADTLVEYLSGAGTEGGEQLGKNLYSAVTPFGDSIGASIADQVGNSGESAGNIFASTMQSALSRAQLVMTVVTQVAGYFRSNSTSRYKEITGNDYSILGNNEITIPKTGATSTAYDGPIYMVVDGQVFARLFTPYLDNEKRRYGVKLATGGAY